MLSKREYDFSFASINPMLKHEPNIAAHDRFRHRDGAAGAGPYHAVIERTNYDFAAIVRFSGWKRTAMGF